MPTLILPPRYTPDTAAMWQTAINAGWNVERLPNWRVPQSLVGDEVVLYGEPLFAAVVAEPLGLSLLEPSFTWLAELPFVFRQRDVSATILSNARKLAGPLFIKPADDKCFVARIYDSGQELPGSEVLDDDTPVLVSQPVTWEVEFRCFVLDRMPITMSPYLRSGKLAQLADGSWPASAGEQRDALQFAKDVLRSSQVSIPPACVLDVGMIKNQGWAVVEANAAWGSGIYGCDPSQVLKVIQRACVRSDQLSESDRAWVLKRGQS